MAVYQDNETGKLVTGHFFQLYGDWSEERPFRETKDWIVSSCPDETSGMSMDILDCEERLFYECTRSKAHVTGKEYIECTIDHFGGILLPICRDRQGISLVVNEGLKEALESSVLKGTKFIPALIEISIVDRDSPPPPKFFVPTFPGRNAKRSRAVIPAEGNKCPYCGTGPVYCPVCGFGEYRKCDKCGKYPMEYVKAKHDDDPRIMIMPLSDLGDVIDGSKWDGSDFFGGIKQYATRRAVDFLLSIHAAPFKARPLRTWIDACSNEQLLGLELAKRSIR